MRLMLVAALIPITACHASWEKEGGSNQGHAAPASGSGATRSFNASGFTGVNLRGSDNVDVKQGASFSVTAEGGPKVLDVLDIRVDGDMLRVSRKPNSNIWSDRGARIHVVLPKLTAASVSGSGDMQVDRGEGDFHGAVAGSGNLEIAALAASAADLSIAGSGDMRVAGTAGKLNVSLVGSGDMDAGGLAASGASISVTGSGSMKGKVSGGASVNIAGSGDVDLTGGAKCSVNKIGSGEAHCS